MKRSSIIVHTLRAVFVVLAYKEITHPKSAMIPPGTGRSLAAYLKSSYQIARAYLRSRL